MEILIEQSGKYGLVVSSRVVAKELGKRHDAVLRDLENILKNSTPQICGLFIQSEYKASNGKMNKEYLLTKDGFTLYMFNIQGYQEFKMAYIQKFNEMEKILNQQLVDGENTLLQKEISRLKEIEKKYLESPMSWTSFECVKDQIDETIKRRCEMLGITGRVFKKYLRMELEKEVCSKFGISKLTELKEKDYKFVMPYIFFWLESYALRNRYITL